MKNLICTTSFLKAVNNIRQAIIENIIDLMKRHNVNEICPEYLSYAPTICIDSYGECYTLDSFELINNGEYDHLVFNGSGENENTFVTAKQMDIELLVDVYNWIKDNQDDLFNE
jgi:hypothetical protein